jgi:hypothetical protein
MLGILRQKKEGVIVNPLKNLDKQRLARIVEAGNLFVHTPAESSAAYVQYVRELHNSRMITWGCGELDNRRITPIRPGEITTLVMRPGSGKTSLMVYMARKEALRCDVNKGQCVVYISWEEPIESIEMSIQSGLNYTSEQIAFDEVDPTIVEKGAVGRADIPIVLIGRSLIRDRGVQKPPMFIDRIYESIQALYYEFKIRPVLILADYLQKIPIVAGKDRTSEVSEAMFRLKDMIIDINCPLLLGAQATRDVDENKLPIPTLSGAQWSSVIEQESDRMIGGVRPSTVTQRNGKPLEEIEIDGRIYNVTKDLMILRLLKQRKYFPPKSLYAIHFDPARFQMADLDPITGAPMTVPGNVSVTRPVALGGNGDGNPPPAPPAWVETG